MLKKQISQRGKNERGRHKPAWVSVRLQWLKAVRTWRVYDRQFGTRWRIANGGAAVLLIAALVIPVVQQITNAESYRLSAEALQLVGRTDPALVKQLSYDTKTSTYQFNKDGVKAEGVAGALATMHSQVGTATGQGKDKSLYALDVPTNFSKGVTYHDVNSQLSFSLVPQFKALQGKNVDGHVVFPLSGDNQAVYTLKNNGLKEDIVVPKITSDTMTFRYTLDLPDTLEAKVIPGSNGAIGIYSADATLFGNISYGSNADQTAVENARVKGNKTNLVFGLPSPIIKAVNGNEVGSARFELNGNQLSVVASGLTDASGPVTIDPSVVVTSSSDFQTAGNSEDNNIDFSTSGQIARAGLTGGSVASSWSSANTFSTARGQTTSVAYNGYLYVMGGEGSSGALNDVQYVSIGSNGALGTWASTTSFTTARYSANSFAYDGYLYIVGGTLDSNVPLNDVQYAPINSSTGAVGTWTATTSFTTARSYFATAVYNGYAYVIGGKDASNNQLATVQYAPLNADGTVGTWTATTSFTTARSSLQAVAYNGYLYMGGGYDGTTTYNDVQYAPISSTGTVGSWTATSSFTTARSDHSFLVSGGYLYLVAGYAGGGVADVQYAPINANGSLGTWVATTSLTSARFDTGVAAYNGYIYVLGGYTSATTQTNAVLYAKVNPAGQIQAWPSADTTHSLSANRALNCVVAYNGYLYSIGGSTSDTNANNVTTVQSSAIAANGTIGTWSTLTALPAARGSAGCAAANGYLYVIGGYAGTGTADGAVLYNSITSSGTIGGTWTSSLNTPTNLNSAYTPVHNGVFVYGNYIYSVGGDFSSGSGSGHTNGTFYATINPNSGAVGTWASGSSLIATNYSARAYALVGKYLYAMGGIISSSGTAQSAVEYAVINSDGTLGTWTSTTSMPGVLADSGGATVNGCIYVVGGENGAGTSQKTVYSACPSSNGSIASSAWQTQGQLPTATTDSGVAGYHGYLYSVAGWTTAAIKSVEWTAVNNGGAGTTGTFTTSANNFATARENYRTLTYNGYLYVIGGSNGSNLNSVQYAALNKNGSIGTWAAATNLSTPRSDFAAAVYNGYIYILGGITGSGTGTSYSRTIQYAPINSDGTLGSWAAISNLFATGRNGAAAAVYNGYMYILGGQTSSTNVNDVQYAPINSDGTLGTWATTNSFTTGRYEASAIAYGGYMYLLGGADPTPSTVNTVQYAPINSDGTLGTWVTTNAFLTARAYMGVAAYNGFLYIVGGGDLGSYYSDVQYAAINTNGSLGTWSTTTSLTTGRMYTGSAIYNGYIYAIGGSNGTDQTSSDYASLNSIARTARYSKLIDLGTAASVTSITYNGTLPRGLMNISYRTASSNAVLGSSQSPTSLTGATSCTATTRYVWVGLSLDDSFGALTGGGFTDANGTLASVTDFTVNYSPIHPQPSSRMRNGLSLQNGTLGSLDTCA